MKWIMFPVLVCSVAVWQQWDDAWFILIFVLIVPAWALNVWSGQYLINYYRERRSPVKQAEALCKVGQRIDAIKLLREHHGWPLKEAKEYCDRKWPRVS